jgi:hypothetical protein
MKTVDGKSRRERKKKRPILELELGYVVDYMFGVFNL